ncbi:MAG: PilZ domain-containing protein [Planctomycetota bacterium]|nr:PilZ domain-containing protein [Planctomycetota bacterium]
MPGGNRRQAERVPVRIPVQLQGLDRAVEAVTADLSRSGARLRIQAAQLGPLSSPDLEAAAKLVRGALSATTEAHLHYRVLGPLIRRTLRMTRIALPTDDAAVIELGCSFDVPLSHEETLSLGAPLPPMTGDDEAPLLRADMPAPFHREIELSQAPQPPAEEEPTAEPEPESEPESESEPEPAPEPVPVSEGSTPAAAPMATPRFAASAKHVYRTYLKREGTDAHPTLLGKSDQLSRDAIRVRVLPDEYAGLTVMEATMRFAELHGTRGSIKLMDGHQHLYTGPVRVCSLELPPEGDVLVTLAFERRLNPAELRRLGLSSLAA